MIIKNESEYEYVDEFIDSLLHLEVGITQLSSGRFSSKSKTVYCDSFYIDKRSTEPFHVHETLVSENNFNFCFPDNEASNYITLNNQELSKNNQIAIFEGESFSTVLPKNFALTSLNLKMNIMQNYLDFDISKLCPLSFRAQEIDPKSKDGLRLLVQNFFKLLLQDSERVSNFVERDISNSLYSKACLYISEQFSRTNQLDKKDVSRLQRRLFHEAIHESPITSLNVQVLAKNSCMSVSKLFVFCRKEFGMTPNEIIVKARLNKAREILSRNNFEKVFLKDVMYQSGVTNASRFRCAYRDLFGELPTETLKRSIRK